MNYIEVSLVPTPFSNEIADVLAALLAPLDYDSFSTESDCLKAYCPADKYDEKALAELLADLPFDGIDVSTLR